MKYFKNTELAKLYNVSEKSVRNWIEATRQGKLDLQLHEENGKHYIANTSKNTLILEPLVEKGKKYRNTRGLKTVAPTQEFYNLYETKQILDIIANLDIHREIPYQYNYFDGGADHWDRYTQRLVEERIPSTLTSTIEQLEKNTYHFDNLLADYDAVNVIDIGAGNGLPVRDLLRHLLKQKKLKRYIAIDISQDMLKIVERNIRGWFGESVHFESYVRDISYERFEDLLVAESFGQDADKTINVITLFGGTIFNLRDPERALKTINDSMGKHDLLINNDKLDSERSRRYFDFAPKSGGQAVPDFRGKAMLDLLNIDQSYYTVEQFFDQQKMMRVARVNLEVALSIEFRHGDKTRIVTLNKGDKILLWRAWHYNAMGLVELFNQSNFDLVLASRSRDLEYILLTSKIKTD